MLCWFHFFESHWSVFCCLTFKAKNVNFGYFHPSVEVTSLLQLERKHVQER